MKRLEWAKTALGPCIACFLEKGFYFLVPLESTSSTPPPSSASAKDPFFSTFAVITDL